MVEDENLSMTEKRSLSSPLVSLPSMCVSSVGVMQQDEIETNQPVGVAVDVSNPPRWVSTRAMELVHT